MSIQFFHERLNSTHKPTRFSAHLYQFRVEVFRICHCQSEWYFRWPCQEADKWGKDRRWVIHKWFIGLLFDAVWMLLYSIRFIVVLFCFVLNFISSFFLNCKVFGCFFFRKFGVDCLVDQVLDRVCYSTWPPGHQVHPLWFGKSPWKLISAVEKLVESCSHLFSNFLGSYHLLVVYSLFAALGASMLQRITTKHCEKNGVVEEL